VPERRAQHDRGRAEAPPQLVAQVVRGLATAISPSIRTAAALTAELFRYIVDASRNNDKTKGRNAMHGHHTHAMDPRMLGWLAMGRDPRRHHGGGRRGGGQWGGFPGFAPPRGPRARRGDVRAALLVLLAEQPRNGYQLMQEIEERSDGVWRPSPGSVYPALQQLEDEGLVRIAAEGRKTYELTDEGRKYVEENAEKLGSPWDAVKGDLGEGAWELMDAMRQIGVALFQLTHSGTEAQREEAKEVIHEARRALYRILADERPEA
jgi:DNA-binding PadR family transcriptional regulator